MSYHQVRVGLSLDEGDFNRIFEDKVGTLSSTSRMKLAAGTRRRAEPNLSPAPSASGRFFLRLHPAELLL